MFGSLGVWEIALIVVLALLLFGPRKLPEIGRTIGKGLAEFKKASNELKRSIETEIDEEERRPKVLPTPALPAAPPEHTEPGRQDLV